MKVDYCNVTQQTKFGYQQLAQEARLKPFDKKIISSFFLGYDKSKDHKMDDRIAYLQLKYLNEGAKWKYLNDLSDIYLEQNKKFVAFMCSVESLRINPTQNSVFKRIEELKEIMQPRFPQILQENNCAVSVIMRTFDRFSEIKSAIQSVLNQTFHDYELIIINIGGSEAIKHIVDSFGSPKIKYYYFKDNRGQAAATNEAIIRAKGKYITYLDDDDIYYPHHLELLVKILNKNEYQFVYSNTKGMRGNIVNGIFKPEYESFRWDTEFDKSLLLSKIYISNLSVMHCKSIFYGIGLFREDMVMAEDWELWLRAALKFDFFHLREDTGEYRQKHNNMCVKENLAAYFFGKLVTNYYQFYQEKIAIIKYYSNKNDLYDARKLYKNIVSEYPHYFRTDPLFIELINSAKYFKDNIFMVKLAKDYFQFIPRNCIKEIITTKSFPMFLGIFPILPGRVLKSIRIRIFYYFKFIISKSINTIRKFFKK